MWTFFCIRQEAIYSEQIPLRKYCHWNLRCQFNRHQFLNKNSTSHESFLLLSLLSCPNTGIIAFVEADHARQKRRLGSTRNLSKLSHMHNARSQKMQDLVDGGELGWQRRWMRRKCAYWKCFAFFGVVVVNASAVGWRKKPPHDTKVNRRPTSWEAVPFFQLDQWSILA